MDPVEFAHTRRELYLREWETSVSPAEVVLRDATRGAFDIALAGLKSVTTLNGGGLVLIPAYVGLFSQNGQGISPELAAAISLFALGLVVAMLAYLGGYFTMLGQQKAAALKREKEATRINRMYFLQSPGEPTVEQQTGAPKAAAAKVKTEEEFSADAENAARSSERLRWFAIACAIASLAAFIVGGIFGGLAIAGTH